MARTPCFSLHLSPHQLGERQQLNSSEPLNTSYSSSKRSPPPRSADLHEPWILMQRFDSSHRSFAFECWTPVGPGEDVRGQLSWNWIFFSQLVDIDLLISRVKDDVNCEWLSVIEENVWVFFSECLNVSFYGLDIIDQFSSHALFGNDIKPPNLILLQFQGTSCQMVYFNNSLCSTLHLHNFATNTSQTKWVWNAWDEL